MLLPRQAHNVSAIFKLNSLQEIFTHTFPHWSLWSQGPITFEIPLWVVLVLSVVQHDLGFPERVWPSLSPCSVLAGGSSMDQTAPILGSQDCNWPVSLPPYYITLHKLSQVISADKQINFQILLSWANVWKPEFVQVGMDPFRLFYVLILQCLADDGHRKRFYLNAILFIEMSHIKCEKFSLCHCCLRLPKCSSFLDSAS